MSAQRYEPIEALLIEQHCNFLQAEGKLTMKEDLLEAQHLGLFVVAIVVAETDRLQRAYLLIVVQRPDGDAGQSGQLFVHLPFPRLRKLKHHAV